jgi:hypothetical protein
MQLFETLQGWLARDAQKYLYLRIPSERVAEATYDPAPLRAGQHYFRLWLTEMCLRRDREWFASWHPAVHSVIRLQFSGKPMEVPYVAGPLQFRGVDSAHLDQVVHLNHPLTALMPFNGGVVEVIAGLLAMRGENYLARFIKVMGDFSELLAVPQLSAALQVAGPLANGLQELLGIGDGQLHLGLHQAFTSAGGGGANDLQPGYLVVVLADERQLSPDRLWVLSDRLRVGESLERSQALTGYAYMLFRIEGRVERDDWEGLENIQTPFQGALEALGSSEPQRAEALYKRAMATALQSPDLTRTDRRRVAQALKEEYDAARSLGLGATGGGARTLTELLQRAPSVEQAAALGDLSWEEAFAS